MAQGQRFPDKDITISKVGVIMEVAAAETCRSDPDLKLFWSGCEKLSRFLCTVSDLDFLLLYTEPIYYTKIFDSMKDRSLNCGRHRLFPGLI